MEQYTATLTGSPFLYNETKTIAKYLLQGESPTTLRKRNIEQNLIQYKTQKSISRVNTPIFKRLGVLTKEQLEFFTKDDIQQSKYMLIYAIMKTDRLVKEFMREIYYDKLLMKDNSIEKYEIEKWFNSKFQASIFLNSRPDTTKYKLKQVLMQIMTASGLVKKEKNSYKINRPLLSDELINLLDEANDIEYAKTIGGLIR